MLALRLQWPMFAVKYSVDSSTRSWPPNFGWSLDSFSS